MDSTSTIAGSLVISLRDSQYTQMTNSKIYIINQDEDQKEIQYLNSSSLYMAQPSVIFYKSQIFVLLDYIKKMPEVYEVYQKLGDFKPKQIIDLGGTKQTGKLFENDGVYEGEWKDNQKCGFGNLIQLNKGFYQGYFENDEFTYEGRFIGINGSFLEGQWNNSKLNGIGIIKTSKYNYKGEVKDGEPHGEGFKDYAIYYYKGQFYKGVKHGKGKHTFIDGSEYEGDFYEGKMQGKGCYRFPNHKVYEGDFNDGEITGEGTIIWPNGERYKGKNYIQIGHCENGLRHGFGVFKDQMGVEYEGNWTRNEKDGQFNRKKKKIIDIVFYKEGVLQEQ